MISRYQYTYRPAHEAKRARAQALLSIVSVVTTVACAALIGVLLAWRG